MAARKIPARYGHFVFVFLVALPLSMILSFANTAIQLGFNEAFWLTWLLNWGRGFVMVYPLALLIVPLARKLIIRIVHHE